MGDLHNYLIQKHIPVPKIYKTKNENYVENNFILYEFIDGEQKNDWTDEEMVSLTSNFAHMLQALKKYPVPEFIKNKSDKYVKGSDIEYCYKVYKPLILKLAVSQSIKDSIVNTIDILYGKLEDFNKLPKYFMHGDLNEMNALFKDEKNVGIIDIGGAYEPIVYDLGEFLYWFTMPYWSLDFNTKRYELIIKTFENILPLSPAEKMLIPYMMLRRGMMDVMLTLENFWSGKGSIPEQRLQLITERNIKITNQLI